MKQIYKFKNEEDFLNFESQKIKTQIHDSAQELFQHASAIFSLTSWVKKYPFASVGTAFSVGVMSSSDHASHLAQEIQTTSRLFNISALAVLKNVVDEVTKQIKHPQHSETNNHKKESI